MNRSRWRFVLDLLFPRCCALCSRSLDEAPHDLAICEECASDLKIHTGELCPKCGAPLGPHAPQSNDCRLCRKDRFAFEGVVCLGVHDGNLRNACLRGKSATGAPVLHALTQLLLQHRGEALRTFQPELILPVPQHWRTRLTHTHNPAELIAEDLATSLKSLMGHRGLRKVRFTSRQASLPPTDRRKNLKSAFVVEVPSAVRGARIILVDDVLTTGSTANECAKALKAAGAERIFVAVLTRGLG